MRFAGFADMADNPCPRRFASLVYNCRLSPRPVNPHWVPKLLTLCPSVKLRFR